MKSFSVQVDEFWDKRISGSRTPEHPRGLVKSLNDVSGVDSEARDRRAY